MPKNFSHETTSWKLFEIYFLENGGKDPSGEYLWISQESRGSAINLSMSLNRCNMQWHRENGVDPKISKISARPIEKPDGTHWVEICESKKNSRKSFRLMALLEQAKEKQAQGLLIQPRIESIDPEEPGISPMEKLNRLAKSQELRARLETPEQARQRELDEAEYRRAKGIPNIGNAGIPAPVGDDIFEKMLKRDK